MSSPDSHLIPPQPEATGAARLDALGMTKRFGAFTALDDVSITVSAGSLHALLGENGAGKSTLVKSLIGFYEATSGSVSIDGRERRIASPRDASRLGIGMIFQHFTVVPGMTVAENLALADPNLKPLVHWKQQREQLTEFMRTAPFKLALDTRVATLAAGEKQKLEILKALYARRRFLILDEPTSVLTPQEADEVLGQVRALTQSGALSVLMITHKFREVYAYCDEVTVLRRGKHAGWARVSDVDRDTLAGWMMGTVIAGPEATPAAALASVATPTVASTTSKPAVAAVTSKPAVAAVLPPTAGVAPAARKPRAPRDKNEQPRMSVRGLVVIGNNGLPALDRLDVDVLPGEIVGVAGISGNGQRELMAALTGVMPISAGTVQVDGAAYRPTRSQMRRLRVAGLPEEPLINACVGKLSVAENIALRNFDRPPLTRGSLLLSRRAIRAQATERIAAFSVKTTGPDAPISTLSGGNVQRAVLGRELSSTPRLLLVANPCFGLDFAATAEIHARLRAARDDGAGVLLISEDLDEILALADRVVVMSHGTIAMSVPAASADIGAIGRAMAGDVAHAETKEAA